MKNTYILEKNGQKHELLPLNDEGTKEDNDHNVLLMSEKQVMINNQEFVKQK